jgi:hypothetical protein
MEGVKRDYALPSGGVVQIKHPRLQQLLRGLPRPLPLPLPGQFLRRGFHLLSLDQGKLPSPPEQSGSQLYQFKV